MKKLTMRQRVAITRRGYGLLKKYCPGLAAAQVSARLLQSLQPYITVWFSARIINELAAQRRPAFLWRYVAAVLLINLVCTVGHGVLKRLATEKENMMWCWFGKVFADKQQALDYADLESAAVQRQRQAVEKNLYNLGNGLAQLVWGINTLVSVAVDLVTPLAMTVGLFAAKSGNAVMDSPLWLLALLGVVVLAGLINSHIQIKSNQLFEKWCESATWFNRVWEFFCATLQLDVQRAADVRLYRQDIIALREVDALLAWNKTDPTNRSFTTQDPALEGTAHVAIGLANGACALFVVAKAFFGAFGVGSVVQYITVLTQLGEGIRQLMFLLPDNAVYCGYLQQMFDYLDLPSAMYQGSLTVEKRDDNEYFVEFRDVSFRYPGADNWALRHLDLKFRVGEKLAVVGRNGSGKTTFIKLLCRLYDPTEGEILLNGVNIQKYDYDEYRALFSVVFQDFQLFAFSLGQNVAASADYDAAKVTAALQKAGLGQRLSTLPRTLETKLYKELDAEGVEISGGEAQKIALARALYRDAPFVLLDEPTAALDPVSEYEVYSGFDAIVGDKTTVYISHRLASCRFCDKITVFDDGRVVQTGTHEQLLHAPDSLYATLWQAQAQYYNDSRPTPQQG